MSYYDWSDNRTRSRAPRGSFRTSPIFVGIVVLFVAAGALAWLDKGDPGFDVFLFVVAGWLASLCLHEFAHAFTAYRFGDMSVAQRGYLTLNPLKYAHWLMSIVLPLLFLIAGGIPLPGGAVFVDHANIQSRGKDTTISLVGPATNVVFAAILSVPFALGADLDAHPVFWSGMAFLAWIQLITGVINLLPIPGLDGGNAIYPWLSGDWRRIFDQVRVFGFFIMMLLLWQTSFGATLSSHVGDLLIHAGIPNNAIYYGEQLFRFWKPQPNDFGLIDL
jgi:Zn-dependent protease